ncbi:MAG: hypothetical protein ACRDOM_10430 [Nocardioides sp.]
MNLTVGTHNLADATVDEAVEFADDCVAVAWQEGGDRGDVVRALSRAGHELHVPDVPGGPSTPLSWHPSRLRFLRPLLVQLHPGGDIGPGTGPDDGKPKWLVGGYFVDLAARRRVAIGNVHLYAGQKARVGQLNRRARIGRDMLVTVATTFEDYTGVPIVGGDYNTLPTSRTVAPLRDAGWACSHDKRRIGTHGKWTPDHVWWRPSDRIAFVRQSARNTHSDHDALQVVLDIHPRGRVPA